LTPCTLDAIVEANARVDRALRAGALALGAQLEIDTLPGYLPLACDTTMAGFFRETAHALFGAEHYRELGHRTGSTDMGDLSQVIPVLHPYMGGARGSGHGPDYEIVDEQLAYVAPAKALSAMAVDLLWEDAAGAREVLARATPRLTREGYLTLQRGMGRREVYDGATVAAARGTEARP
jgi:metal-dependent amidase/aminoacylase/carboxypeptidase family protein